jgi:hypothetical protein
MALGRGDADGQRRGAFTPAKTFGRERQDHLALPDFVCMELAGLEPAASWVRSSGSVSLESSRLQRFSRERLECHISRNILEHRL